jgi:hypothetical protein
MIEAPVFKSKEEEVQWMFQNKSLIIAEKTNNVKKSDSFLVSTNPFVKTDATKSEDEPNTDTNESIKRKLVINTTNLLDSHLDVHIKGCFKKTLSEISYLPLLQEHEMCFDKIIATNVDDGLKAYAQSMTWKSLGFPQFEGSTEALIFETPITKARNEYMFNQYMKGYVRNHSIGMRYVKIVMCINSEESMYTAEKENWDKYYPMVVNNDVADSKGYFWAVTELKLIEGSAVVKGSNYATPTLESKNEPLNDTQDENKNEPSNDTQSIRRRRLH